MKYLIIAFAFLLFAAACSKEKEYTYGVNPVTVKQSNGIKTNIKTTQEFISIAYSDLFGNNISQTELLNLNVAYNSFGDKKLIEDMIIRNFLKKPGVQIPTKQSMRNDIKKFVNDSYKKFLNREAGEYEKWYLNNLISSDTTITAELVYYSFLTSNEYRYY